MVLIVLTTVALIVPSMIALIVRSMVALIVLTMWYHEQKTTITLPANGLENVGKKVS